MSFPDHSPPPPFMPAPFDIGGGGNFWNQAALNNEDLDSNSQLDHVQSFKRLRNSQNNQSEILETTMRFPDHPPPPPFIPAPFDIGGVGNFWDQAALNNEDLDSNSQMDHVQSFKRPRNSGNTQSDSSHFPPMNPRMNPPNLPTNRGTGHIFYKTRICLKFLDGNCRNGEHCTFAHGPEDLREPPPNWQEIVARKEPGNWNDDQRIIHRMKICKKFANGEECPYGENCNFLHKRPLNFESEMEGPRESSAISIGTTGPMIGNRTGSDQIEGMNNKHVNSGSDAFRVNMKPAYWKTKLCSKWEITGQCPFGERCHFAHGQSDLQAPGGQIEAEIVNTLSSSVTIPVFVPQTDAKAVLKAPAKDNDVKKCFKKWKAPKKLNSIYADWLDDMVPPLCYPSNMES